VYPAAGLVNYFRGDTLAIINYDETGYDEIADIVINDKLSNVIKKLMV
jgi:NAD-dependent deacetylase